MSEHVSDFLEVLSLYLDGQAQTKVTKAIRLWIQCDQTYKRLILQLTGYSGKVTAPLLRAHFDFLDLVDGLDSVIEDMEDDIASNKVTP